MAAARATLNPFFDTRGDVKVNSFSWFDTDWDAFKIKLEAYTDLLGMSDYMDDAELQVHPIDNDLLSTQEALDCSKALYSLLVAKCEGKALGIVTLVQRRYGPEAWRLLKAEYEGRQGSHVAAMLRGILNPSLKWQRDHGEGKDLIEVLTGWERDVARYRVASGEDITDNVLIATVLEHVPAVYREGLRMIPQHNRDTYASLRSYIREWCVAQRTYDPMGNQASSAARPVPMEVDAIKGGKSYGKMGNHGGKDKGKSKSHGKGEDHHNHGKGKTGKHGKAAKGDNAKQGTDTAAVPGRVRLLRKVGPQACRLQEAPCSRRRQHQPGDRERGTPEGDSAGQCGLR